MLAVQTFTTQGLARRDKLAYWNDITRRIISDEKVDPVARGDFSGCMRHADLGPVRIIEVTSDAARVRCSRQSRPRLHEDKYILHMQLSGTSVISQDGQEVTLANAGDFTLCEVKRPRLIVFDEPVSMLIMVLPAWELIRRINFPGMTSLLRLSGAAGTTSVASACLRQLWMGCAQLDRQSAPTFARVVLDLVASAFVGVAASNTACPMPASNRRLQILDHIERHLPDDSLCSASVARHFGISTRHLYTVFGEKRDSVSRYILRRRLEECARRLSDASKRQTDVTSIAIDQGFRSLSHFCKAFRERFGVTPLEYRHRDGPTAL